MNETAEPTIVAEWQEPQAPVPLSQLASPSILMIGGGAAFVILVGLGFFLHYITLYFIGAVVLTAAATTFAQSRRQAGGLVVRITDSEIIVGSRAYPVENLAGFWLDTTTGMLAVNLEPKKVSALPITFLYENQGAEECRDTMLTVLDEVEPREATASDNISSWLRR